MQRNLRLVQDRAIAQRVSLIFGLPFQTLDQFKDDVGWCQRNLPSALIDAFPLMLLRGTPLYEQKAELGLVEQHSVAHPLLSDIQRFIPHVVETPHMHRCDWDAMASLALDCRSR